MVKTKKRKSVRRRRPGRPKLAAGVERSVIVTLRLRPDERQRIQDAAGAAGQSLSDWVRQRLLA